MKKTLLSTAVLFTAYSLTALTPGDGDKKNTIEFHAKGSANSTFLFNNNISDAGDDQDYAAGWGFNYGAGFTMYFGKCGFGVEGLFGNHKGAYAGVIKTSNAMGIASTEDYTSHVNLTITQIPVLFKMKSETGGYFEVGPQYNMISKAEYNFTSSSTKMDTLVSDHYAKSYFSAVIGVGFKVGIPKTRISILAGLRLQYSLTDLEGVDALGTPFTNPFVYKEGPQSTAAATGGFMLGAVYTLGEKKAKKEKKKD